MSRQSLVAVLLVAVSAVALQATQRGQQPKKVEPPPPIAPLVLADLLSAYDKGAFDETLAQISALDDKVGRNIRAHWELDARPWIEAEPEAKPRRLLVAATFALETERLRVERGDWNMVVGDPGCSGGCVLDWAQGLIAERGAPDEAERKWNLAAIALVSGVRDWRYLQRIVDVTARTGPIPGFIERALFRFPEDSELKLEQALANAGRFSTTVDGGRIASDTSNQVVSMGPYGLPRPPARPTAVNAAEMLEALKDDPITGAEALMRAGYLRWAMYDDDLAKRHLKQAAERTKDTDTVYLSRFLLGWILQIAGKNAEAIPEFQAALVARPDSQSAALMLATLRLQQGDANQAHEVARASIDKRRTDDDPWRLFLYGHHPKLAERMAQVRAEVRR